MAQKGLKRKLAAILSADAVGYRRLMGKDEEATIRTLTACREVMSALIWQHNGTYPLTLEDLVPGYISTISAELVNDGRDDLYGKIRCVLQAEEEPIFIFHTIRGPDSAAVYHIQKDSFWYEP